MRFSAKTTRPMRAASPLRCCATISAIARRGNATWFLRLVRRSSWIMPTIAPSRMRHAAEEWLCAMPSSIMSECRRFLRGSGNLPAARVVEPAHQRVVGGLDRRRLDRIDRSVVEILQVERNASRRIEVACAVASRLGAVEGRIERLAQIILEARLIGDGEDVIEDVVLIVPPEGDHGLAEHGALEPAGAGDRDD